MDEAVFADWALKICLTGLIIFGFYRLEFGQGVQSGQIRHRRFVLVLGLGVFGFVFKELLIKFWYCPNRFAVCRNAV